jgi:hypothetical protein
MGKLRNRASDELATTHPERKEDNRHTMQAMSFPQ